MLKKLIAAAGLACMTLLPQAQAEETTIRFSNWLPPTHPITTDILYPWAENVAAATRTLDYVLPGQRGNALRGLSTRDLRYRLIDAPGPRMQTQSAQARGYADNLARILGVESARVRVAIGPGLARGPARDGPDALVMVVRLDDGRWLAARQRLFE